MSDQARNIPIRHTYSSIIEAGWHEMVRRFRPVVRETAMATEVNVLFGLALRITRLAIAADLLARKGLDEECHMPQRAAVEAYVNLCYIFYSGPNRRDKSGAALEKDTRMLCLQFIAYADVAYLKLVKANPERVKATFQKRQNLSDADYDRLHSEHERLADVALNEHGCRPERWHPMNIQDMAKKVLQDPPPFLDEQLCAMLLSNFVSSNSAVHSDSLSIRSQYKDHGTDLLELVFTPDSVRGDVIASLAVSSWKAVGWYLNDSEWVTTMVNNQLRTELKRRFESARPAAERVILLPTWLEE